MVMKKLLISLVLVLAALTGSPGIVPAETNAAFHAQPENTLYNTNTRTISPVNSVVQKRGLLLFFVNPNGRPCQLQNQVINSNRVEIEKRFKIRPVMTTNQADRMFFYQFGVRQLPTIILLKNDGTVFQQLSPGIHSKKQLLDVINRYQ
jgi:thioredoxin-related protein